MNSSEPTTSIDRPLRLRGRRDLIMQPLQFRGMRYWSIKDPLSLRYYQLCDEERFLLEQLDGGKSLNEIKNCFEIRFAPRKLATDELYAFLGTLHREGLVISQVAGQGEPLLERHERARRNQFLQALTNLLAIRIRGIDPEPMLRRLYPSVRWMFSRFALIASLMLVLGALLSLVIYAETFIQRLPHLQTFLSAENLLLMAAVLAGCKILHELGHALTCKHFGGECHELGLMLLVFTPCLYCNVSDAWMMRSKWQRIAISAAGIYVELLLASFCTFLWWFSRPGIPNSIFLNVMFVCSVSTILFNGNPLLRYDGYFILADLIEIPNLRQQSQSELRRLLLICLGDEYHTSWTLQSRHHVQLAAYGLASIAYRWMLIVGILFVIYRALEPYRLESVAQLVSILIIGSMIAAPIWKSIRFFQTPRSPNKRRAWYSTRFALIAAAGVILIGLLPVSHTVTAPIVIEPADAVRIHVTVPGTLVEFAGIGQRVEKGQVIAKLTDTVLDRELAKLRGECEVHRIYCEQLQKMQVLEQGSANDGPGSRIATAKETLEAAERQLAQKNRDHARLTINSPRAGVILPTRQKRTEQSTGELPTWSGAPLDDQNLNCYLAPDTELCLVGEPNRVKGTAWVDQTEIERIKVGQTIRILVDELHEKVLIGTVSDIARLDVDQVPPELVAKKLIADNDAVSRQTVYAVGITLGEDETAPLLRSSGRAKIAVSPRALAASVFQQLCNTFRIDL